LVPGSQPSNDAVERAALIHREILQLSALIVVAIVAFLLTRGVAASNREMSRRDAAEWYRRGQQALDAGRASDAIDALRRATVRARDDKRYELALAHALALEHDDEAARSVLLNLREAAPEDPDINLPLARLAATRQDVTEALRFYHNALYAPWSNDQADARRAVRLELIRFLLTHGQASRALSELLSLISDLPDDVSLRLEVAGLFVQAGDSGHALDQFQRILRVAPDNGEALIGAGQAAFRLANYPLAQTYFNRAPVNSDAVRNDRDVVNLVLSNNPLAKRLGSSERRRRLATNFSYARQRLTTCIERLGGQATPEETALQHEADAFESRLKPPAVLEQDTIEDGLELIDRVERVVAQSCGPLTAFDQALVLLGRPEGAEAP
jgi:tetratricopeptide (TPR) repeat protein